MSIYNRVKEPTTCAAKPYNVTSHPLNRTPGNTITWILERGNTSKTLPFRIRQLVINELDVWTLHILQKWGMEVDGWGAALLTLEAPDEDVEYV